MLGAETLGRALRGVIMTSGIFSQTIIVGVGLLGGALGLASKRAGVGGRIIGLGRNESKLTRAVDLGAIDVWATSWTDALGLATSTDAPTLIVFCAPVEANLRALDEFWTLRAAQEFAGRDYLISDVGSVKTGFAEATSRLRASCDLAGNTRIAFVPAHPIAGSDKSGVEHSTSTLFDGKLTILTPWSSPNERRAALASGGARAFRIPEDVESDPAFQTIRRKFALAFAEDERIARDDSTHGALSITDKISVTLEDSDFPAVSLMREFWRRLGSFVVETSAAEHDHILARTSHLPNLASVLTMSAVPMDEFIFAGTGFRDVTRLSGGNPEVWTEIFETNRVALLDALERVESDLLRWKTFLSEGDREAILTFLKETKKKRDALGS